MVGQAGCRIMPMPNKSLGLDDALYDYLCAVSLREPPLLRALREETAALPAAMMQIAPEQGQFMALLARICGATTALEVGVFTGYSSLSVALALPREGRLIACDINREWTAVARRYWAEAGVAAKIDLRLAPALETLDALLADGHAGSIDFSFIDADKANYQAYFERVLELSRPGALILIDNVLWSGKLVGSIAPGDVDTAALRAFNECLHGDQRIDLSMLPLADGLSIARKR
jgi:caffeoyl-CoA O-methyltransferase